MWGMILFGLFLTATVGWKMGAEWFKWMAVCAGLVILVFIAVAFMGAATK